MATQADWILIVGGGILQVPAVKAAHELGYRVLVTDRDPECACAELADRFIPLDTFDVNAHVDLALGMRGILGAVFTAGADPIVTVAKAAQAAGCHGVPKHIAQICADKDLMRFEMHLENNGYYEVPQPRYWVINSFGALLDVFEREGYGTYILKAPVGSGSRGHTQITALGKKNHIWLTEFLKHAYYRAASPAGIALLERWLDGTVLSVETLWHDGETVPLNAVERPFDGIIELGHYNPLIADAETYSAIWRVMEQAGRAIGMHETQGGHILKGDLIITDDGPKVIELTTRLSGGFDSSHTSPLAHGVNYTKGALLLALGRPLDEAMPHFTPRWFKHAACIAVFGPKDGGVIREIRGVEDAQEYAEIIMRYQAGDILPPLVDCTQRVAFCIASDADPEAARLFASGAAALIEVICD